MITRGLKPISCIEIKFADAPRVPAGFEICTGDLQTRQNFIICPTAEEYEVRKNIKICSLRTFLENYLNMI